MSYQVHTSRGISLVETLCVIAIVAILMTIATPVYTAMLHRSQLATVADSLQMHMMLARSEAILRNGRLVICKSASGQGCSPSGGWEQGWIVFHDRNGNGLVDPSDTLVSRMHALPPNVRVLGNKQVSAYVSYLPTGQTSLISGAFQAGTLTICVASVGRTEARQLIIASSGRVRSQRAVLDLC
uniref:GspH/FimT family pseudopilin n=1 Tax=Hylemonella sp. TaxID=2066020 RepID=UPI0035AE23F3